VFHKLSRVCKFFANVCLPRVFEAVEFPGSISLHDAPTYKASLGYALCTQIAEEQPVALSLAQTVRACHFTNSQPCGMDSWVVDPLTLKKCVTAMTLMTNIRELQVSGWYVNAEHWSAITALPSLEDLSFHTCRILDFPVGFKLENRLKLKASRLSVLNCDGCLQTLGANDMECLRMLTTDFWCLEDVWLAGGDEEDEEDEEEGWLSKSAVTDVHLHITDLEASEDLDYTQGLYAVLTQMPRSLEVLCFSVDDVLVDDCESIPSLWASILDDPTWENASSLRSLTVRVADGTLIQEDKHILSLSVNDKLPEVQRILDDKLDPGSGHIANLRHVDFFGRVFRLVDGQWKLKGRCSTVHYIQLSQASLWVLRFFTVCTYLACLHRGI